MSSRPDATGPVRPRSVLRARGPQGAGTPLVVSLPGHIAAVAWDLGLPPVDLLHWIADAAAEDVAGRSRADWEALWTDLLRKPRASLSGLSTTTRVVVTALDRLFGRDDTEVTTALAWAPVIPTKGAFRRVRAWCPACYLEWDGEGRSRLEGTHDDRPPLREPLLWQFTPLSVCVRHAIRLRTTCPVPGCGALRGALAAWAQPGYCACGAFLGESRETVIERDGSPSEEELAWGEFVTRALGELIVERPSPDEDLSRVDLAAAVQIAVENTHDGTYTPFASAIRMSLGTVSLWKDGRRRPTLSAALRICAVAGFRLPDLLAARLDVLRAATPPSVVPPVPPSDETHRLHDPEEVLEGLEQALRAAVPPSLAQVTRQLRVSDRHLSRAHPDLCTKIIERHRRWIEDRSLAVQGERQRLVLEAIADVQGRGAYPARNKVEELLPRNVSMLDPRLARLWKDELVRLGWPRPDRPIRSHRCS